jgi:predicted phosphate transport protein (TIGR00153 family)
MASGGCRPEEYPESEGRPLASNKGDALSLQPEDPMLWGKSNRVETMLSDYFDRCDHCYEQFERAFQIYFEEGCHDHFDDAVRKVNKAEGSCDDLRREIEYLLYGKALLPESRGDLLGLLETFDKLPNIAETVAFLFSCQSLELPADLHPAYKDLLSVNIEAYHLARRTVDTVMSNPKATLHVTKDVEHKESESDRLERDLIRAIFRREIAMGEKLALKEAVLLMGKISDRAESLADRVAILAIKRQI